MNMIEELSDVSRTNQLKIEGILKETVEDIAKKLFEYLFKIGKGIEVFSIKDWFKNENFQNGEDENSQNEDSKDAFYRKRHRAIKNEIKKRLSEHGENWEYSDIQYFFSYSNGEKNVFFLSPNKTHSGWIELFCKRDTDRVRILNLIFKVYLLLQKLPISSTEQTEHEVINDFKELPVSSTEESETEQDTIETINGFEKLLLVHSKSLSDKKDALFVWGQNVFLNYNYHNVVTLTLSRKSRLFWPEDQYVSLDGEDMGELLVYKGKNYYFKRDLDARSKNYIYFMRFDKVDKGFKKFKKTQLYHYQNLMTKLGNFLDECGIAYKPLPFQADHYLENPFIKNVESTTVLEIINNSGTDLTEPNKQFLENFLRLQGVSTVRFYEDGKTISTYQCMTPKTSKEKGKKNQATYWTINEVIPWTNVKLDTETNYLIFNKSLSEESGSMAYQLDDGSWKTSTKINGKKKVDFYSQLKRDYSYLNIEKFFSIQGMNVTEFRGVKDSSDKSSLSVLVYDVEKEKKEKEKEKDVEKIKRKKKKIDEDILRQDTQAFTDGRLLNIEDSISCYVIGQKDSTEWEKFRKKHKIKISPEFEKILLELGIKDWIRRSLLKQQVALLINPQPFSEKRFFAIYVRRPRNQPAKAVAVEFLYKKGYITIENVLCDVKQIETRFPILKKWKSNPDILKDDQEYFVDELDKIHISCYADDYYTPKLIGRNNILEDIEAGTLEINRQVKNENSSRLLPLVTYYNGKIKPFKRIYNMICLDLTHEKEKFIQYYVPPISPRPPFKNGFPVYHMIGYTYSKEQIAIQELINHPIVALHFNTLTQNILKISENSKSSLLQKVAKVFIEN